MNKYYNYLLTCMLLFSSYACTRTEAPTQLSKAAAAELVALPHDVNGLPVEDASGNRVVYAKTFSGFAQRTLDSSGRIIAEREIDGAKLSASADVIARKTTATGPAANASSRFAATSQSAPFETRAIFTPWGFSGGLYGLAVADMNGDKIPEFIATASAGSGFNQEAPSDYWYVAGYDSTTSTYKQLWTSPTYSTKVSRLIVTNPTGQSPRVIVATEDGMLRVYSDWPLSLSASKSITSQEIRDLAIANIDGTAGDELVASTATDLIVLDAETLTTKTTWAGLGGSELALGQLDDDAALEVVVAGSTGRVIDGESGNVEWTYTAGFGRRVHLANLDDDSQLEIISVNSWYGIVGLDPTSYSPIWEIKTDQDIATSALADINSDGVPELLVGDGQWGKIRAYDLKTRLATIAIPNPEHGVAGIAVGDFDNDGTVDLVWSAGHTSSGKDIMAVSDSRTAALKWQSEDIVGPYSQLATGDVDGDGKLEIVFASSRSNSGYSGGTIYVLDAETLSVKWKSDPDVFEFGAPRLHQLRLANLRQPEVYFQL